MFAGIVSAVGRVVSVEPDGDVRRVDIETQAQASPLSIGGSISCAGICLTIVAFDEADDKWRISFDVGPETLQLTTAGNWKVGARINLERALRLGDELGGHLITGHVDGVAGIVSRKDHGETLSFRFVAPELAAKYIASKGSIALDGTSLTVNRVDGSEFECQLIPHTLAVTTWSDRQTGGAVNLEVDLIARYAERLLALR